MKCKRMHVVFFKIDTCKISVYNFANICWKTVSKNQMKPK